MFASRKQVVHTGAADQLADLKKNLANRMSSTHGCRAAVFCLLKALLILTNDPLDRLLDQTYAARLSVFAADASSADLSAGKSGNW